MIKKSFRLMLLVAFALSSVMFVACNKYDDDIERIDGELAALNATVQTLKAAVDGGAVISSVSNTAEGVKFTLSNGQSYVVNHGTVGKDGANGADGKDGQDGKPGSVVTIGENGNWHIDGVDQGVSAVGASTFVVDCGSYYELNVLEKVEGENAEIVKINLPKTAPITDLKVWRIYSPNGVNSTASSTSSLYMYCGEELADDIEFNGVTYEEGMVLNSVAATITAVVNPLNADANLYDFVLVDSKGNSPFVVSNVEQNVSEGPLTRADETPNKGVWDMKVSYASNTVDPDDRDNGIAYALATTTVNGVVATAYDIRVYEQTVTNPSISVGDVKDSQKRTINLNKAISNLNCVVDYYFEINDQTIAAAIGAELDGTTLTATTNGTLPMIAHYLLVDGTIGKKEFNAVFEYITPSGEGLDAITWTVQKDDNNKDNGVEVEYHYLPIAAVKSALVGKSDSDIPSVAIKSITWADGTALNKKSVVVNGAYYGKAVTGKSVTTIAASDIATIDATPYVWDAKANNKKGAYVVATDINKDLFVKVKFNSQTALVGEYTLNVTFTKAGESNPTMSVPVALSIVAPENVIVKNEPYFAGDNAVVYGVADGTKVTADLDDLFTTTGMTYTVTKIKQTSSSSKANYSPWLGTDGAIEVPVKATDNANYCVGTTQEFTASKNLFPRVENATYTFNVTVTSPVVITYTGAAKTINEDPITIAVDEFTGKSLKTGDALYIGKIVADKTYNVDPNHIPANGVTVGVKADDYAKYVKISDNHTTFAEGTVTRKDAEGKVVSTVDAVQVERVAGIAQQSPVTCTVNVTVKDLWGVSHVIPVAVTVNPLQ